MNIYVLRLLNYQLLKVQYGKPAGKTASQGGFVSGRDISIAGVMGLSSGTLSCFFHFMTNPQALNNVGVINSHFII